MGTIRLTVGGDFGPIARIDARLVSGLPMADVLLKAARRLADASDLFIINLEVPLTRSKSKIQKAGACLKAIPEAVSLLQMFGANLVTLATNHMGDFGEKGVQDTIRACREAGIETVGAGLSFEDARRILYREVKGRRLAIINMAEQEFGCARPGRGGVNPFDIIAAVEAIHDARAHADHVILILHGGLEGVHIPSPESIRTLRFLAEQGPTAIVRHHAHAVQGHELWKGVPILYGLGNLLFDWSPPPKDPSWYEGVLGVLEIDEDDSCEVVIHPFEQRPAEPALELLGGDRREDFDRRYREWCRLISDEDAHRRAWHQVVCEREDAYLNLLCLPHPLLASVARKANLSRLIRPFAWKRRFLENILRCGTHRELLIDILTRASENE